MKEIIDVKVSQEQFDSIEKEIAELDLSDL